MRQTDPVNHIFCIAATLLMSVIVAAMTSCGSSMLSVADAQMARGEFFEAAKSYRKIYNKLNKPSERPLRGEVAFKLGECHRKLNQPARAAVSYQNALRYGYPDDLSAFYLGRMLQQQGKYAEASKAYLDYLALHPDDVSAAESLRGCRLQLQRSDVASRVIVKNAKLFNSRRSDYAPVFHNSGALYFTSTNEKSTGTQRSGVTGTKRGDIWVVRKDETGQWQRPRPVEGELNTAHDEGIISFSPDGQTMYLTRSEHNEGRDERVEIFTSRRQDAQWSEAVRLDMDRDSLSNYGHPSVSPSGQWLYFTSDRPGYGAYDICRMNLMAKGSAIENLGPWINTPGNELFPYALTDSILYFASDGHAGLGGLDLFRAELTPSGGWKVENLGAPVNSSYDDFGIAFESAGRMKGYFSSNRGDARGYDHLYSFELPDLSITISGHVLDMDEEPVADAVIRIVGNDGTNRKAVARNDGSFSFPLERGVSYVMLAGAPGYLNAKQEFTSDTAEEDAEYSVDFSLASLTKPNIVENIFYDFDKATLRPESKSALDGLADMLRDNPNITIEMAAHTDRVGSDSYNERLSARRAQAVVDYLVDAGISPDRLQARGYGKSRPKTVTKRIAREYPQFQEGTILDEQFVATLTDDDRQAADQINRRTEFDILSLDYGLY